MNVLEKTAAWVLAIVWLLPLLYAMWSRRCFWHFYCFNGQFMPSFMQAGIK